ncbi:MAG: right-handed parallel beta-helix repeat-containing protein, partial [Planctomycetota bacterium]
MIMRMVKSAPVLMFLFAASAAFALPRTIHVPGDFGTIQEAINDCNDGDTVIVAEGTYTGAGNKNLDFLGKAIALLSTRPDDPAVVSNTVIDCQNSGRAFNFHSGEDANSIVSGFTITGGSTYQNGAGIYCTGASPSILNCAVTNNYAENCGGGIYCASNSNPVIINCTVSGNTAKGPNGFDFGVPGGPGYGGGIYGSLDSHLTIEDCTITGNTASGGVAFGGVVPPAPADGNAYGGGIYGSATINNCIISENTAAGGYSEGGTSRAFGGGIYGIVEIMNSKITGNTSVAEGGEPPFFPLPGWFVCACGGGVFSVGDSSVTNCLIAQNQAYKYPESVGVGDNLGGGLCADPQAEVDIRNCTIVTNTASGDYWEVEGLGGGIYSNSITTVANSILWANAADSGTQIHGPGPVSYSDVQGGRTGEGNINADPLFTNPAGNDYHLEAGSPCINVGDNNAVPPSVVTDLDGNPRIYELTVIVTGGYGVVEPNGGFYPPGTVVTLTTTPGEGYRLAQWTGTDYDSSLCLTNTVTMNGDRFVMVELEESHHRILYVGGGPEYTTIQDAIDDAREGDIVVISTGTYPGNILLRGANITLTSTVPDDPMIVAATIIKGTAGDRPAVTLTGCENETCVLDGLTIADGNTAGNGGGISGNGAQATISNCVIRNNHADDRGGGISDCDGSIRNCTITDNSAVYGGGMSSNNGTVNLANCTFTSNSADWTGGGVHCLESDLQIENSTFAGNSSYHGAGLYGMHSVGQVSACTFRGNTADYNDPAGGPQLGCGGGLYCFAGDIMVLDCVITENTARGSGGGGHLLGPGGTPELINCLVANNTAGENGGGVCCAWYAESIISNCTIADNLASTGYGGGLLCSLGGNTIVTNCVIWENSAASGGPQIGVITDDYYPLPSTLAVSYCDVEGGQSAAHVDADCTLCTLNWGAGNIDTDPLFADPAGNDYHLEPGSPCINVGDNNAVPPSVVTDLDGNPRIIDGTVDMGAYELPRILYVDADASGANDGSSWEDAFTNLHDAIQAAGYGSEVWVAQATYKPTNRRYSGEPRSVAFNLKDGVMVYGGFNGTETSQSQRDPNRYETILSGDLDNDGLDADNAWHVVEADTEDVGPTGGIDGFTVTGGYADGQSPENNGGGIYIQHESPTVANCKIMCNYASMSGGGVYSNCGDPTLTNCAFIGNAAAQGGGIACWSGSPTLTNCMFGGNSASGDGGGIACADSNVTVTNCTCAQNSAFVKGGAIFGGIDGNLTMTNSIVWDNSAEFGPQIYLFGGSLAATYSNIQGGYAGEGNIDADPQFVDANNGDYHLGAGSPCVDVGDNSAVPSSVLTDMDGNPRIINGVVDLGPYETIFFYVDGINGNDGNNGRSPETAFATIQRGINSAQDGCVVLVYPAVYLDPDPNVWESIDFLGKNIKLTSANPADWNT